MDDLFAEFTNEELEKIAKGNGKLSAEAKEELEKRTSISDESRELKGLRRDLKREREEKLEAQKLEAKRQLEERAKAGDHSAFKEVLKQKGLALPPLNRGAVSDNEIEKVDSAVEYAGKKGKAEIEKENERLAELGVSKAVKPSEQVKPDTTMEDRLSQISQRLFNK